MKLEKTAQTHSGRKVSMIQKVVYSLSRNALTILGLFILYSETTSATSARCNGSLDLQ